MIEETNGSISANAIAFVVFLCIAVVISIVDFSKQNVTHYCKAGYVFLDNDSWHGEHDQQLIGENGGGVPCSENAK